MVMVWPALKPAALATGITVAPDVGGSADRGAAWRANRRDDGGLAVRARINNNRLAGAKVCHAGDFDIVRAGGRIERQDRWRSATGNRGSCCRCRRRPGSGRRSWLGVGPAGPPRPPKPPRPRWAKARCSHFPGTCLGNPAAAHGSTTPPIVEAVNDQSSGVTQHHAAVVAKGGTAEPLVGRRRPLVARGRDCCVTHHRVDLVVVGQGLSSVMPVPSGWSGSLLEWAKAVAGWKLMPVPRTLKGRLARVVELQRGLQFETRAAAAASAAARRCADALDRDGLGSMADAVNVQIDLVADRDVGRRSAPDRGVAGFRVRRQSSVCVPGLPTSVTVTTSYFSTLSRDSRIGGAIAEAKLLADLDLKAAAAAETATPPPPV